MKATGKEQGPFKNRLFFTMFEKRSRQKPQEKTSPSVRDFYRNRPGVVESVGREPLMFAKVENDVTESCQKFCRKNRKNAILALSFPRF